ncbi:hypothetical protein Lal_00002890 [Lupinus albus]|uniref:Putative rapid ALkalinization Factor n=1 Tax=Lupinus albus TaxID=3870 RepID=A0A6A5NI74_LUPAL|nr:putative rapid ALkalinization Factor [Lupinus albus]KAF1882710.1 hypothetical protein Lal_00002890 [Lupinus albus]
MAMSKGMLVVLLSALLVCTLYMNNVEGRDISNGALQRGTIPGCSPKNPTNCKLPVANPYKRPCEIIERCRDGKTPPRPNKGY